MKSHTRQISGIGRDSTQTQMLRHLPLSCQNRAHPLAIIATYAIAGTFGFAVTAAIINLILDKP